ncbi:hypothetical protein [Streptomyces radiopugnans]|uniref:Uncharacterized protein n=1 Tax=Streptomyces radiopugnans TaxID=403935 RepID=A0A1H9KUZ1_9ACTN|nr:hypothetical protein [Streptomyces radiopugnans]SER03012.1 hypothetical protein SAMN05216481_13010 [Streptomyces radiopugnans]
MRIPQTTADLRRVADHPATRCLLACLLAAMARRVQAPSPSPAPARRNGCSS